MDLCLKALDNAFKWCYQTMSIFREEKMLKSAKAKVDDPMARESYQLCQQMICKICTATEALGYGAERFPQQNVGNFMCAWTEPNKQQPLGQMLTIRRQMSNWRMTPVKRKLFDKLFQCHGRQLLQEVRTKATGPKSIVAKSLALMNTAGDDEAYKMANMATNKRLQFQIRLYDTETEATTWSLPDTEWVTTQLQRVIYGVTLKEQKRFKKQFSIRLNQFEAW